MTKAKHPASRAERRKLHEKKDRVRKTRRQEPATKKNSNEESYTHVRNNHEGEPFVLVSIHD